MSKKDYYEVLGLKKDASSDDIKRTYRKLAMQFHPDRNPDDPDAEEKFKEIGEAYENLSNAEKKAQYDSYGHIDRNSNPFSHGKSHNLNESQDVNEFIKSFFGSSSAFGNAHFNQPQQEQPQKPIHIVSISLEDAYTGKVLNVDGRHVLNIPKGARSGAKFYSEGKLFRIDINPHHKFKRSENDLLVDVTIDAIEAMIGMEAILDHLDGVKLQFNIPQGIQPGQIIKLTGKGMKNPETDKVGDTLIRVAVTIPKTLTDLQKDMLRSLNYRNLINI